MVQQSGRMAVTYETWMKSMTLQTITRVLFTSGCMWAFAVSAQDSPAKRVSLAAPPTASPSNVSGDHWSAPIPAHAADYRQPLTDPLANPAQPGASSMVSRSIPSASGGVTSAPSALPVFQPVGSSQLAQASKGALEFATKLALTVAAEKTGSTMPVAPPPGQLRMPERSTVAMNCQASALEGAYATCTSH